jgi:2-succinyl-5-enolpyruvyl-6-hydroxy-3-cyclohexene-1-carboxylate synthase
VAEELQRAGVQDVVICPGSRSTPLALALRMASGLRTWVHLDERAAGFFALGAARASRRPVAILVTSGTAAAELLPAVVEAAGARVPLVVLTADRPPELRDRGAAQTIDQERLYGRFARWYAELPVPAAEAVTEAHVRGLVGRAVATARSAPAGPVHLDAPFREPLVPAGPLAAEGDASLAGHTRALVGARTLTEADLDELAHDLAATPKGVIVCGPLDVEGFAPAVGELAAATGYPILADVLANVRFGDHDRGAIVEHADLVLRSAGFVAGHQPDVVVRFGGTPVARSVLEWMAASGARQVVVDDGGWTDPTGSPVTFVQAEPRSLARSLARRRLAVGGTPDGGAPDGREWRVAWLTAGRRVGAALDAWLAELAEPFEGALAASLGAALVDLPAGTILVAGNSKPVRDLDAFVGAGPAAVRCLGNRGASGIDGVVSTALGAAAVSRAPVVTVVGDLSFLHDLNALVAARRLGLAVTVVLVDNDGGGIFSQLPQAALERPDAGLPEHFEELFGTPHGLDLGPVIEALGARHRPVAPAAVGRAVAEGIGRPGVEVVVVRPARGRDAELGRQAVAVAAGALERSAGERP